MTILSQLNINVLLENVLNYSGVSNLNSFFLLGTIIIASNRKNCSCGWY